MSMVMSLVEVTDADIKRLHERPKSIWYVVSPDDTEFALDAEPQSISIFARLFGKKEAAPSAPVGQKPEPLESLDLDKSWDILHHLLAGRVWEPEKAECFLVVGGEYVGEEDVGYGPARAMTSAEVKKVASLLARLRPDEVRDRFDPTDPDLAEVYPSIWDRPEEQNEIRQWIEEKFEELKSFADSVAARGNGMVLALM